MAETSNDGANMSAGIDLSQFFQAFLHDPDWLTASAQVALTEERAMFIDQYQVNADGTYVNSQITGFHEFLLSKLFVYP